MKKIKSGVYGLNALIDGGMNSDSTTAVIGAAGAGKTTFAIQFIRKGLEEGKECVFVSLDENKEQIIQEAVEMGWEEILDFLDEGTLSFIDASGKDFVKFIREEFPPFVDEWKGADARIAIDPLTPVIWAIKEQYEQREIISTMFKLSKKIGTVVCTLEEHGGGNLDGPETVIPMYLADCVVHLHYTRLSDGATTRNLKIVKCRNSRHSESLHPYIILKGFGLLVQNHGYGRAKETRITKDIKDKIVNEKTQLPHFTRSKLISLLDTLRDEDFKQFRPEDVIRLVVEEYGYKEREE